eukprot:TRINITY_DN2377_c0_g2_i1.p1 TRINITY_DN2377_c0_g2~~TRINITY_DN2377_c0_g2_i1.p1  ORF type:complete len:587 (+),score=167.56 TRINITY_DN2377_c0_g2_i1:148-1908(+)
MARHAPLLVVALLCVVLCAHARRRSYEPGDEVPTYMSTVGPYRNPSQTYKYHHLPFCQPDSKSVKKQSIGETLDGLRKTESLFELKFRTEIQHAPLCKRLLTLEDAAEFIDAIDNDYYFTMFYDDIPLGNFVGLRDSVGVLPSGELQTAHYLPLHMHFTLLYHGDNVIYGNVSMDASRLLPLEDINTPTEVTFSYSASWAYSEVTVGDRAVFFSDVYLEEEAEIRWLSLVNSIILAVVLVLTVLFIMHRIRSADRGAIDDEEEGEKDDNGWKLVHGDVFRFPNRVSLLCAFCGAGAQLLVLTASTLALVSVGFIYTDVTGSLYTSSVALYALTCAMCGGISAGLYKQMNGKKWAWNILLAYVILSGPVCLIMFLTNFVADYYRTTTAIPFGTIVSLLFILAVVGFPMTVIGGIAGRRMVSPFATPVRTKLVPREIPHVPWHRGLAFAIITGGFLPFSAIYLELFYIFESVWGHVMYSFDYLPYSCALLVVMTSSVSMALTFFQLNNEDYRWWWQSALVGGSPSLFVFLYSVWFFVYQTNMDGVLQTTLYFSSAIIVSYCFFLLLAAVGFYSSLWFVRFLYRYHKCD